MNRDELFNEICEVCKDVFEDQDLKLTEETSATDIEKWDSLAHLNIINELEENYSIKFTLDEVTKSKNLGDLLDALMKHINKN